MSLLVRRKRGATVLSLSLGLILAACASAGPKLGAPVTPSTTSKTSAADRRTFSTEFESWDDFAGMYISPQTASTKHGLVASPRHNGRRAHCAWLTGPGTPADKDGPNHRGYPTVQLWRLPGGGFKTPAIVSLWVWVDVTMVPGQWVSLATLSADASDRWSRVVTVNIDPGGWLNVFHVPLQGQHLPEYETHLRFPMRRWVHISIVVDFDPQRGFIEVRQSSKRVARARVLGGHGVLEQAHFGMYAIPSLTQGTVCNDDLKISEVRN